MGEDGFVAHVRVDGSGGGSDEPPHGLEDHLTAVAGLAKQFAGGFGATLAYI